MTCQHTTFVSPPLSRSISTLWHRPNDPTRITEILIVVLLNRPNLNLSLKEKPRHMLAWHEALSQNSRAVIGTLPILGQAGQLGCPI